MERIENRLPETGFVIGIILGIATRQFMTFTLLGFVAGAWLEHMRAKRKQRL